MSDLLEHINYFNSILLKDSRLHSSHVSLYLALLLIWKETGFDNALIINRAELMTLSKIGSKATYHKCIRELEQLGYIKYSPTYNSFIGSLVELVVK